MLLIDHAEKVAEKIRISGGGRCNFTNLDTGPANFVSANPDFCRSALARYTPQDFIALVERHGIAWHEKHKGQLFCDDSSAEVIEMLLRECDAGGVTRWQPCAVDAVARPDTPGFELETSRAASRARQLVIATGGLSIPKIGASDFGYRIARQFGHSVEQTRPALVPLTFDAGRRQRFAGALRCRCRSASRTGGKRAALRRRPAVHAPRPERPGDPADLELLAAGTPLRIDLAPGRDLQAELLQAKRGSAPARQRARRADAAPPGRGLARRDSRARRADGRAELRDRELAGLAEALQRWRVLPAGAPRATARPRSRPAASTPASSIRAASKAAASPGLYFIGEVVDVTGWLGGYNFQWAWASAAACARRHGVAATVARGRCRRRLAGYNRWLCW